MGSHRVRRLRSKLPGSSKTLECDAYRRLSEFVLVEPLKGEGLVATWTSRTVRPESNVRGLWRPPARRELRSGGRCTQRVDYTAAGMSTLHLGTTPWGSGSDLSGPALARSGELAEQAGFESFWLPESHFVPGANPSPLIRLAAVAGRTEKIRLGTTSYLLPIRNPILAAEEVAVLDQLSDGRVILGVGRGFRKALFDVFEVVPAEKRALLERALQIMKSAWAGEAIRIDGAPADSPPIRLEPRPVQDPHPPIWVAAFGPKALAQVGGLGLPYLASPMESFDQLIGNHGAHTEALASAGHNRDEVPVPIMRTAFVGSTSEVAKVRTLLQKEAEGWRDLSSPRLRAAADTPVEERALLGEASEFREQVARYREQLGMTHLIVRPMLARRPAAEVRQGMDALREALA